MSASSGSKQVQAGRSKRRIATSFISFEQASRNLQLEVGNRPACGTACRAAEEAWNSALARIEIEGATDAAAAHVLLLPVSGASVSAHLARAG